MPGDALLTLERSVQCLRDGEVLAYPTEAVYGLGCDPTCKAAVLRILELKSRPATAGLILIADSFERFEPFVGAVAPTDIDRALESWPGPVTWLFPRSPSVPDWLAGDHPTIALRVSAHPVCRALSATFGGAIVSTSANPAGREPARSAAAVAGYFGGGICGIAAGELGRQDRPSEIRDLATGRVLRAG